MGALAHAEGGERGRREEWARREKGCSERRNGAGAKENMKERERTEEEEGVRRKWKNERKKVVKSLEGIAHEKGEEERKTEL